jgi:hypothetical protein
MITPRALLTSLLAGSTATALRLNITAISAENRNTQFECWELDTPFIQSSQNGLVGTSTTFLGDVTNMTYNAIKSNFDSGFHNPPFNQ